VLGQVLIAQVHLPPGVLSLQEPVGVTGPLLPEPGRIGELPAVDLFGPDILLGQDPRERVPFGLDELGADLPDGLGRPLAESA
jgi:hypothetical protein